MNTNIKILNLIKAVLLIVITSFMFACSKCDNPVPMSSTNSHNSGATSIVVKDKSASTQKTSSVVGGDDNEDDDDNRGHGFTKGK